MLPCQLDALVQNPGVRFSLNQTKFILYVFLFLTYAPMRLPRASQLLFCVTDDAEAANKIAFYAENYLKLRYKELKQDGTGWSQITLITLFTEPIGVGGKP